LSAIVRSPPTTGTRRDINANYINDGNPLPTATLTWTPRAWSQHIQSQMTAHGDLPATTPLVDTDATTTITTELVNPFRTFKTVVVTMTPTPMVEERGLDHVVGMPHH
jgi:hypothetical protein